MKAIVLGDLQYMNLFLNKGFDVNTNNDFHNIENIDLIVFTGGTDVNPSFYGEKRGDFTSIPDVHRDEFEQGLFNRAVILGIPMVGICRGAQALCAWSGGKIIQHVNRHTEYHVMHTPGEDMIVSSTHHQMMYPWDVEHDILGHTVSRSDVHLNGDNEQIQFERQGIKLYGKIIEPEVVYFHETNALSHQPHPEYMEDSAPYVNYFWKTVEDYLDIKI